MPKVSAMSRIPISASAIVVNTPKRTHKPSITSANGMTLPNTRTSPRGACVWQRHPVRRSDTRFVRSFRRVHYDRAGANGDPAHRAHLRHGTRSEPVYRRNNLIYCVIVFLLLYLAEYNTFSLERLWKK